MNPEKIALVQASFAEIRPHGELFAQALYGQLFLRNPNIRLMFHGDEETQARKLAAMLDTIVSGLGRLDSLKPAIRHLGLRHVRYGVKPNDFAAFEEALLWSLERFHGTGFTVELREAWQSFYALVTRTMLGTGDWHVQLPELEATSDV